MVTPGSRAGMSTSAPTARLGGRSPDGRPRGQVEGAAVSRSGLGHDPGGRVAGFTLAVAQALESARSRAEPHRLTSSASRTFFERTGSRAPGVRSVLWLLPHHLSGRKHLPGSTVNCPERTAGKRRSHAGHSHRLPPRRRRPAPPGRARLRHRLPAARDARRLCSSARCRGSWST